MVNNNAFPVCFTGYGLSSLSAEDSEKWESRRLLQDFDIDSNYTDGVQVGPKKNCTPPDARSPTRLQHQPGALAQG
ncbi:hypothetical protein DPX16_15900 [Anabarilius grahami]|uniref:Uncharacterized protein n=1 Tax=Anabarilius grahami TaxID=495550 RepID=A0A3N0YTP9_ANAGA|nr:hypothetical protein DPX16_15900 [Anabarilius grahami]